MMGMNDHRFVELQTWLSKVAKASVQRIVPMKGDASFRRYFRVYFDNTKSYVAMDAPPQRESLQAFVAIAKSFHALGLNVPTIYDEDRDSGFLLLTDFGDTLYLNVLNKNNVHQLYQGAFGQLLLMQSCSGIDGYTLPHFDEALYYREMSLFHSWYLEKHLKIALSTVEMQALENIYQKLIQSAISQPQVVVHRDYHSRNLMVVQGSHQPGILDFQDAVRGPITYDLLSLLRDCYIDWPVEQVKSWVLHYQQRLLGEGILQISDQDLFLKWFDWIGLQRNLKCIGIFSRLNERDSKPDYLKYIPRVLCYAREVCERYPELNELNYFLKKTKEG